MQRITMAAILLLQITLPVLGQDLTKRDSSQVMVNYEAYVDFHYAIDPAPLSNNIRPFASSPLYINQFGLSYAYIQADVEYRKFFARASFHTGEVTRVMYADEDYLNKIIRELSLTYQMSDHFEVQAGIFPAIFGSETFINKDNLHATRATMTDFAPDFETGLRVKYKFGYWQGTIQMTNGWQVIQDNNASPAFGLVNIYDVPGKFMINYGIFAGNEVYESKSANDQLKIYNNIFGRVYVGRWTFAPMADFGMIRNPITQKMDHWNSIGASIRFAISREWGVAMRYEHLEDPHAIINELISPHLPNGIGLRGSTITVEYLPSPEVTFRVESRWTNLNAPAYELADGSLRKDDYFLLCSVAIRLHHESFLQRKRESYLKSQFY